MTKAWSNAKRASEPAPGARAASPFKSPQRQLGQPAPLADAAGSDSVHWRRVALVLLTAAMLAFSASAQPANNPVPPDGFQAFRAVLRYSELEPLANHYRFQAAEPRDVVLVVLGRTEYLDHGLPANLDKWVRQGGALLVATDRAGGNWPAAFGTTIVGAFIQGDAAAAYRNLRECPFVRPEPNPASSPFGSLTRIATNRPSFLLPSKLLPRLAGFAGTGMERVGLFGVGGPVGAGRVLVMADHSVFINDMMLKTDNDNLAFAMNCVQWLMQSEYGPRKKVLLVEEGTIVPTLDFAFQELPVQLPPLPSAAELVNQSVYELQQKNALPNFLYENVRLGALFRFIFITLTAFLAIFGLVNLLRHRHRVEPGLYPIDSEVGRLTEAGSVVEQRHQAMLQEGNLWEAARTSARQGLAVLGAAPTATMPPLYLTGSWWQRRRLRRQVTRLWQLACAPQPRRISLAEFARLSDLMAGVQDAWRRGEWHFGDSTAARGD